MRILHFADLHLGVESYGHPNPETGLSTRLEDFLHALDEVVDYALDNRVSLVLFCGDAYKSREPTQTHQREFARRIARLAAGDIPVFLLIGNHDLPNAFGRATAVEIFDTLAIKNVTVAARPGVHRIETRDGILQIAALPWMRRSALLVRDEYRGLPLERVNKVMQEMLTSSVLRAIQELDPGLPAILAAHVAFSEARTGSEQRITIGQEPLMLLSSLPRNAFDYIALGHMHQHQTLSHNPQAVYSGSLQPIDFGEEGEPKGFCIVELDPAKETGQRMVSFEFKPVTARRFLTIEVKADSDDPTATVISAIRKKSIAQAVVRVQIKVPAAKEGLLQENEIRKALTEAHFAVIAREVEREHRTRLGGRSAEGLTPLEALQLYLESKNTPAERAREILEYGERLLSESREPGG